MRSHRHVMLPVCLASSILVGCGEEPAPSQDVGSTSSTRGTIAGSTSPRAVFEAFREATSSGNWTRAMELGTRTTQEVIALGTLVSASLLGAFDPSKQTTLDELLETHGLGKTQRAAMSSFEDTKQALNTVTDLPRLVVELSKWMEANADDGRTNGFEELRELKDLEVDGDQARGIVTIAPPKGLEGAGHSQRPIEFRKVAGSWKVHLSFETPPSQPVEPKDPVTFDGETAGTLGTVTCGESTFGLNHVLAYETTSFDEPCLTVLFSERPLSETDLRLLQQNLDAGREAHTSTRGPELRLTLDRAEKPSVRNLSFDDGETQYSMSGGQSFTVDVTIDGQRLQGRVGMPVSNLFGKALGFVAEFDTNVLKGQ